MIEAVWKHASYTASSWQVVLAWNDTRFIYIMFISHFVTHLFTSFGLVWGLGVVCPVTAVHYLFTTCSARSREFWHSFWCCNVLAFSKASEVSEEESACAKIQTNRTNRRDHILHAITQQVHDQFTTRSLHILFHAFWSLFPDFF